MTLNLATNDRVITFDWTPMLKKGVIKTAPVDCFGHVPLAAIWKSIFPVGVKAEIQYNTRSGSHWIATAIEFCGYKGRMRFEGFGDDSSQDKWLNAKYLRYVGYSTDHGFHLMPLSGIEAIHGKTSGQWKDYIIRELLGYFSIHKELSKWIQEQLQTNKYEIGTIVEVPDNSYSSRKRLGKIDKVVGGRVHVTYWDEDIITGQPGFWCHEQSGLLRPKGWCRAVGQEISAPPDYVPNLTWISIAVKYQSDGKIVEGKKFECVNPTNRSKIVPATITKVLRHGYFLARCDDEEHENVGDTGVHCFHISSKLIFPCGFCKKHNISMTPPWNSKNKSKFEWAVYFEETKSSPLTIDELDEREAFTSGFEVGMKLEAVDLTNPHLVAVATVTCVIGRLLKIKFDGWGEEYDQWLDAKSTDIYPIGWCELTGYNLERPGLKRRAK